MIFKIDYVIQFTRAIFTTRIEADDEEQARSIFKTQHPRSKIRKIEIETNE